MLHVHTKGIGVAGVYPFEVAETKAHQVVQFARENEMPLQASLRKSQEERLMLTPELETAIRNSLEDATRRGHEFAALEHLLLALLDDEKTAEVIKQCGGSVSRLQRQAGGVSGVASSSRCPRRERERAQPTLAFARVIQRAVNHVLGAGQDAGVRARTCWWRCSPSPSRTPSPS